MNELLNVTGIFETTSTLWILISAALVFFMQAGFKVLETGLVKSEHRSGIGVKNLMDWVAGSLAFFIIGFGIMFGDSANGFVGTTFFFGNGWEDGYSLTFFIFQLAFAGTALTIVSGAMSGRTALAPYFIASVVTAILVYPIFGHWAWGNLLNENNEPWLASLGFMDFAGSTVVHSVGAWVGLAGIYMVGPRLGRYTAKGVLQPVKASDYAYSVLGLMILWLGWWGFNGGSTLAFDENVPLIILNTNLAASAACFSAYLHVKFIQKNEDVVEKVIGGALTGLVAITACCNVVTPMMSIVIGLLAGLIHNISYVLLSKKWRLDDPVGAIPVHGFGGIFGTLCVALFGRSELLVHDRFTQLGVQVLGILTCMAFTLTIAFVMFYVIKKTIGLRLSPKEEMEGSVFGSTEMTMELDDMPEQTVSQVSVRISDRSYNLFRVDEYLNLPRETRMSLVKKDEVEYLDEQGNTVPTLKAVRYLAGLIEQQRDSASAKEEAVELSAYQEKMEIIGNLDDVILNDEHSISSVFEDSFVLFKPKGKISPNFYWHGKEKGYRIAVIGSCLDRNISNSFLSAMTISLLNEVIGIKKVLPPERILGALDQKVMQVLRQSNDSSAIQKGIEMAVLVIDDNKRNAYFSASGSDVALFVKHLDSSLVKEYKGLDATLGTYTGGNKPFERLKIEFGRGDAFYLASMGMEGSKVDANGNTANGELKLQLANHAGKSMMLQKDTFNAIKEIEYQDSDVILIGIKP